MVGVGQVKAVNASDPDPSRYYNMADGNIIDHKGQNDFRALGEDHKPLTLTTKVADVDTPLMSVPHIVHNGGRVLLSQDDCHIEYRDGSRDRMDQRGWLYVLKLWAPGIRGSLF